MSDKKSYKDAETKRILDKASSINISEADWHAACEAEEDRKFNMLFPRPRQEN